MTARALMLIDVQRNMLEGANPAPDATDLRPRIERVLADARAAELTIVHVQNDGSGDDPDLPGTDGWELVFPPLPGELVVRKTLGNAFRENPDLDDTLRALGVDSLTVVGLQSDFCVTATIEGALDLGFDVDLASGAHATYDGELSAENAAVEVEKDLAAKGVTIVMWSEALVDL